MTTRVLILPGLGNSGPDHWQSHWERGDAACRRVEQDDWDAPDCKTWVTRLSGSIDACDGPLVLAAHSAACALVAHWVVTASSAQLSKIRGALLVAPSDPTGPNYPRGPRGFAPVPTSLLPFRSITVTSDDDPYVALDRARDYAAAWGSELVVMPGAGHINAASGHGPWPEGFALLSSLRDNR